jgi:hypothetical protein
MKLEIDITTLLLCLVSYLGLVHFLQGPGAESSEQVEVEIPGGRLTVSPSPVNWELQ